MQGIFAAYEHQWTAVNLLQITQINHAPGP